MRNACLFGLMCLFTGFALPERAAAADVSFKGQLAPILARRCLGCHDNRKTQGRYALHTFEQLLKPGNSGEPPVVPGKPNYSFLLQKLVEPDESVRMPQEDDPLSAAEIALFRDWIVQGAKFDGPAAADRIVTLLPPREHPQPPAAYRMPLPVFAVCFSPDGQSLYTAGLHEVLVWETATGRLQQRLAGMPQRIHALRLSPDGQTLAVAGGAPGEYGEIRLVKLADKTVRTLPAWEDVVLTVAFSPDGKQVLAGGADNSLRAYEFADGRPLWRTQQHIDWVTALDVTDYRFAEEQVANAGASELLAFDEHEKVSGAHVRQHWQFPDGRFIVREANWELAAGGDQPLALTRITVTGIGINYKVQREAIPADGLEAHAEVVALLQALHADWGLKVGGTPFVVSASRDRTVKVFSLQNGHLFTTYKGHRREYGPLAGMHRVFGVAVEPGTRRVWSGGEGQHFHGWNPVTVRDEDGTAADMESRFAKEYSIDGIRHDFRGAIFGLVRSGTTLFAAGAEGQVAQYAIAGPEARYDLNAVSALRAFPGQRDQLFAVDASTATQCVAAAGFTGEVVIWNTTTGAPVARFVASPGIK